MAALRTTVLFLVLAPAVASAGVLYKSVDASGIVTFSDMPPPPGARLLEQREIPSPSGNHSPEAPSPIITQQVPYTPSLDADVVLRQANSQVDEAERALAEARRVAGPTNGALRLDSARLSMEDEERIEREKRNVKLARQRLMEILRERRLAMAR